MFDNVPGDPDNLDCFPTELGYFLPSVMFLILSKDHGVMSNLTIYYGKAAGTEN